MSQAEFAEKLGKATTTYQELEHGTRDKTISFDELVDIAQKLNISIWELLPELPAISNNNNHGTGAGAGVVFGNIYYYSSPDDTHRDLTTENTILKEKNALLEEQNRLLHNLLERMNVK